MKQTISPSQQENMTQKDLGNRSNLNTVNPSNPNKTISGGKEKNRTNWDKDRSF